MKTIPRTIIYCGAEQETDLTPQDFGLESTENFNHKLTENGGRIYADPGEVIETNTPLMPVDGLSDAANDLYLQMMSDRARILKEGKKSGTDLKTIHLNFSDNKKIPFLRLIKTLSPSLSFFLGRGDVRRNMAQVAYRDVEGRLEICTADLHTPESIIGGSAIAIAAMAAFKTGELSYEDFEYRLSSDERIDRMSNDHRNKEPYICDFFTRALNTEGRETVVMTDKGERTIEEIIRSTVKTLKPFIIKYCSQATYDLVQSVCDGDAQTDMDLDVEAIEEDEMQKRVSSRFTRKQAAAAYGKTFEETVSGLTPRGAASVFGLASKLETSLPRGYRLTAETNSLADLEWNRIYVRLYSEKEENWPASRRLLFEQMEAFYRLYQAYKDSPEFLYELFKRTDILRERFTDALSMLEQQTQKKGEDKKRLDGFLPEDFDIQVRKCANIRSVTGVQLVSEKNDGYRLTQKGRELLDIIDPEVDIYPSDYHQLALSEAEVRERFPQMKARQSYLRTMQREKAAEIRARIDELASQALQAKKLKAKQGLYGLGGSERTPESCSPITKDNIVRSDELKMFIRPDKTQEDYFMNYLKKRYKNPNQEPTKEY